SPYLCHVCAKYPKDENVIIDYFIIPCFIDIKYKTLFGKNELSPLELFVCFLSTISHFFWLLDRASKKR
ncbi:hypothetical protein L4D08_25830, partial [Photobacterium chitinilyticum]|uniref:hypothetical protein n=1 Tax=Photobacterium chitinilyticum TaxID=2485123 RepID=UPI003D0E3C26